MDKNKTSMILLCAIVFVLWGGYKIVMASYTAITWNKAEGIIVDFERNTWSCGKGVGECYSLIAGYHADKDYYTVTSDKKFNYNKPKYLLDKKVIIYYSPVNPAEATFGGEYGPMNGGIILFLVGIVIFLVLWFMHKRNQ